MTPIRKNARRTSVRASGLTQRVRARASARAGQDLATTDECVCSFGATRVGPMIERVRLHVTTDRFLAGKRGDKMWEAACDYAALALARLVSRLRPTLLAEYICAPAGTGRNSRPGGAARRAALGAIGGGR